MIDTTKPYMIYDQCDRIIASADTLGKCDRIIASADTLGRGVGLASEQAFKHLGDADSIASITIWSYERDLDDPEGNKTMAHQWTVIRQ